METRFDNTTTWVSAGGEALKIREMETSHLMNTLSMFIRKPQLVSSMLVRDIESNCRSNSTVSAWSPTSKRSSKNIKKTSIYNVTSLSPAEVTEYALNSPLGQAILAELVDRGVNVENLITTTMEEVSYE